MSDATPSRSLQKFLRHKPAIASLGIILIYVATAAVLLFTNLVTLQETLEPIATFSLPGFCAKKSPEKRLQDVERNISVINRALSRSNPAEQLKSVRNGSLVLKSQEPEVLQTALTAVDAIIERLYEFDDLDLLDEEASTETAAMLKDLNSAESMTNELFTLPAGQSESGYRFKLLLGTDQQGRSILVRAVWSVRVAILVGFVTGIVSVVVGTLLGLISGYFGGWIDHVVTWLYSTFASIPNIVLLIVLSFAFSGGEFDSFLNSWTGGLVGKLLGGPVEESLIPVFIAFCATYWIGPCRVIRGEALKLRELEYVQAAQVLGYGRIRILLRHMLPNVAHLMLINFSLLFIGAIKSEVILSFLGLGVKKGPSWGIMINQSGQEVINGFYWQIGTATVFMFGLVLAFNILSVG
jgi:peptide/nickel transport system permease protein